MSTIPPRTESAPADPFDPGDATSHEPEAARTHRGVRKRLSQAAEAARRARTRARSGSAALARDAIRARSDRRSARSARRSARSEAAREVPPHLCLLRSPAQPMKPAVIPRALTVATYNVHRWTGMNGRRAPDAARAAYVISEIDADVVALQEVLRPFAGEDPLEMLSDALGLHLAFAVTRQHRRGQLGNAILSRFPIAGLSVLDISHSRIERRGALCASFAGPRGEPELAVIATHLSLVDRTRGRQVRSLLEHPHLQSGATVLLGDMNAWRRCKATRQLDDALERHHNEAWPATFPAPAPVLALDRVYARGADVLEVAAHDSAAARRASDHLPVVARIALKDEVPSGADPA